MIEPLDACSEMVSAITIMVFVTSKLIETRVDTKEILGEHKTHPFNITARNEHPKMSFISLF